MTTPDYDALQAEAEKILAMLRNRKGHDSYWRKRLGERLGDLGRLAAPLIAPEAQCFIESAFRVEREACAAIADGWGKEITGVDAAARIIAEGIAMEIRARR
jgi:hypothetical protein